MQSAETLRFLAASLRAGASIRNAFSSLADDSDEALRRGACLATAGAPLDRVVLEASSVFGDDMEVVRSAIGLHARLGGDLACTLERLADAIEEREDAARQGRAHVAGARLSARTIALLPLALFPMAPASLATIARPTGAVVALLGVALIVSGLRWMGRLCPDPGECVEDETVCAVLCGCLEGGVELPAVLATWAGLPSAPAELVRAGRAARRGTGWARALRGSHHGVLVEVGRVLENGVGLGVPIGRSIGAAFSACRAAAATRFDAELRRAPVRMVVPLTVCILPAYVLLGIVPFLRGIAGH